MSKKIINKTVIIAGILAASTTAATANPFEFQERIGSQEYNPGFHDFQGEIIESGPTRISLYEVMRGSSEGIAYSYYHERYPENTDWEAVARNFRQQQELATASKADDGES